MGKVKNMTIPRALGFFTIISLIIATILITLQIKLFDYLYESTISKYYSKYEIAEGIYTNIISVEPTGTDKLILDLIPLLRILTLILIVASVIVGAIMFFYNKKLKYPLRILNDASTRIANNNLDFKIEYDNNDEMGNLCKSFEKMRYSLEENNREMWRSINDRKRLNAAFAHDLRTPLTVLKGYSDLLIKYLPQDKLSIEKLLSNVKTMKLHITRLEDYVSNMNMLQRLEDINVERKFIAVDEILSQLKESACIIVKNNDINVSFEDKITKRIFKIKIDLDIIMQVFNNLISNAVRFSENNIKIKFILENDVFYIKVIDDGLGFKEYELDKVLSPFYKGKDSNRNHMGLGLNICKTLCEKHGGKLIVGNNNTQGAYAKVAFKII